ncbi:MAG: thioredoxin-dependent thiol peroxidase [Bacteroidetes bacterium]|jgi:peroxiredoxin Q/BCP|nr:thioredoxin-dependent thiol peroxidase [Bacteroidota bacterium]
MTTLEPGKEAPNFKGQIQDGSEVSLSDYKGNKLILYFYPKDDTPGCTKEACSLRDDFDVLKDKGFKVLGVSPDGLKKHNKFIDKYKLPFDLLADEEKETLQAYEVWGPKKFMGREYEGVHRTTFVIDEEGNVEHIIKKVKTKEHARQILDLYEE